MLSFRLSCKNLLLTTLLSLTAAMLYAQPARVLRIKNGTDATKVIPAKYRFQYPDFRPGTLRYTNGNTSVGKFNYCYLLGEIMFISPKGDTLAISDNSMVSYMDIGSTRYYPVPENGYAEVVEDCGRMLLAKKVQYQIEGTEKKGAYQNTNELGSVYSATTFTDINGRTISLTENNTILLKPAVSYLFMDMNHRFNKATKASLLKIFSKKKKEVAPFLEAENLNYANEEDLKKAIRFCSTL